jgi:hypothetical protein
MHANTLWEKKTHKHTSRTTTRRRFQAKTSPSVRIACHFASYSAWCVCVCVNAQERARASKREREREEVSRPFCVSVDATECALGCAHACVCTLVCVCVHVYLFCGSACEYACSAAGMEEEE